MANTYSSLLCHFVFSTKNRMPLIVENQRDDLYTYIGGIIRNERGTLIEIGGVPDHIHIALSLKTDISVADMLRHIKGGSSRWLNERPHGRGKFAWQDGYGAFSVSESRLRSVCAYIRNQEIHHRRKTFQEEYLEFLRLHNVTFDKLYLWS